MKLLRAFGIEHIADLRSDSERKAMPDRIPDGVSYYACPMMDL